jgi:hypothetical protein
VVPVKRNIEIDRRILGFSVSPGKAGTHACLLYEVRYANGKCVVVRGRTLRGEKFEKQLQIVNLAIADAVEACLDLDKKMQAKDLITYGNVLPGDAFERPQRKPRRKLAA